MHVESGQIWQTPDGDLVVVDGFGWDPTTFAASVFVTECDVDGTPIGESVKVAAHAGFPPNDLWQVTS